MIKKKSFRIGPYNLYITRNFLVISSKMPALIDILIAIGAVCYIVFELQQYLVHVLVLLGVLFSVGVTYYLATQQKFSFRSFVLYANAKNGILFGIDD